MRKSCAAQIENENSYGPILHAIVGQNVRKIHCFAPLTRAVDWRTVSLNVNGTEGEINHRRLLIIVIALI
jgi:hypothetical protein